MSRTEMQKFFGGARFLAFWNLFLTWNRSSGPNPNNGTVHFLSVLKKMQPIKYTANQGTWTWRGLA